MDSFGELMAWYSMQCDGDWEHCCGVEINTLDNPGWVLKVDLIGTMLEDAEFTPIEYGDSENTEDAAWMRCFRDESCFTAYCGSLMLEKAVSIFIDWMKANNDTTPWDADVNRLRESCNGLQPDEESIQELRKMYSKLADIPQEHPEKPMLKKLLDRKWESIWACIDSKNE